MAESDYTLRYEKGNFNSGYCILNQDKIAIVNKYFTQEGKINCIVDIIKSVEIDSSKLNQKNKDLLLDLLQTEFSL